MQIKRFNQLISTLALIIITTPLWATNGYFTHGIGTKNKAMAGAGIAMPEDPIAIANNPAAALATTGKFDLGISVFSPSRSYQTTASQINGNFGAFTIGPNDIESDNKTFFIPHAAGSRQLSDESAIGFAFYGRGGMNTTWEGGTASFDPDGPGPAPVMTLPGTFGGHAAGVDLSQAMLDLTYARSAGENFSWGISLVLAAQAFAARGVGSFAGFTEFFAASGGTAFPSNLTNNGHEFSFGLGGKFGIQLELSEAASFAISYQSRLYMSEFDDYADLFAENGDFDIPANLKAGLTFRPNTGRGLAFSFDVEHTWFSDVDAVGNPISNIFACPTAGRGGTAVANCLGGANGAGFGWDDMTTYKFGVQWNSSDDLTWRAGFSHGDQPIPGSEVTFNILAPATPEDHLTFGFSRVMSSGNELSMALMYAFNNSVSGSNSFDPTQSITFDMDQFEVEFSYGWR